MGQNVGSVDTGIVACEGCRVGADDPLDHVIGCRVFGEDGLDPMGLAAGTLEARERGALRAELRRSVTDMKETLDAIMEGVDRGDSLADINYLTTSQLQRDANRLANSFRSYILKAYR